MIKKMITSALLAGFAAGLIAAALQFIFVQPLLLQAEQFESGAVTGMAEMADQTTGDHNHDDHTHSHDDGGAAPTGFTRNALTVLFTTLVYCGYGLLLVAGFVFAGTRDIKVTARGGILWGLAGFIALQFAPAFGLPPELPGMMAADTGARQIWWLGTALATGAGLWLIAFGSSAVHFLLATILMLIPHLIGAPQPEHMMGTPPPELASYFAARALGVGMVGWVFLGAIAGYLWQNEQTT